MYFKASLYSNLGYNWHNLANVHQVYVFLSSSKYIIKRLYAIKRVKIHIVKRLTLKHFNLKSYYYFFAQVLKLLHTTAQAHYLTKIQIQIFLTNTISTTAQSTAVFSTIAHLLFHNRCQLFSHFLMVIEQFTPFMAQCYLNNWFKVLSSRVTLLQSLVSRLIGTYKQSIKYSYGYFFITISKRITAKVEISLKLSETFSLYTFPHIFQVNCQKFL